MSKRAERRMAAAEETCRALRKAIAGNYGLGGVVDYLQVWMRHSGKDCYADPKPLRRGVTPGDSGGGEDLEKR